MKDEKIRPAGIRAFILLYLAILLAGKAFPKEDTSLGFIDPKGHETTLRYQLDLSRNLTVTTTNPDGRRTYATFDYDGNPIRYQDENDLGTERRYNPKGQVKTVRRLPRLGHTDDIETLTYYHYDLKGDLVAIDPPNAFRRSLLTSSFQRTAFIRLTPATAISRMAYRRLRSLRRNRERGRNRLLTGE